MLRFLKSIFHRRSKGPGHPESLVKAAIERAVDGTDPWIRAVSGYKKKLRPAVLHAIEHVVELVDGRGPLLELDQAGFDRSPALRAYFFSVTELRRFLDTERGLADLRLKKGKDLGRVTALLLMEKRESVSLGAELSGDVVMRDVPQVTVSFEKHRLLDLAGKEEETRYQLKRRAYDHLLEIALGRITDVKARRGKLEKHRSLLQSKLSLLQRGGWGFEDGGERVDAAGIEKTLAEIEAKLLEIGKDDKMLEVYLDVVVDVLSHAEEHLWIGEESLVVDRMGFKRKDAVNGAARIPLEVIGDSLGRRRVVALVSIPGASG